MLALADDQQNIGYEVERHRALFFFQAEDGIRDLTVTGVQTCALPISIYGHLQRLDLRYYDRNPVGRLMTRVTSDVDVLNDLFTSGVVTVFGDLFALVGIMAMMVWMNWRLALVAFSVLPLIALVTQWFRTHVRDSYRVVRGWIARINA